MKKTVQLLTFSLLVSAGLTLGSVANAPSAEAACGSLSKVNSGVFKNWYAYTNCKTMTKTIIVYGGGYDGDHLNLAAGQTYYFETYVYITGSAV